MIPDTLLLMIPLDRQGGDPDFNLASVHSINPQQQTHPADFGVRGSHFKSEELRPLVQSCIAECTDKSNLRAFYEGESDGDRN